ncbi:hypothetical protein BDK51DRAFT_12061, partial [Blyttiomyces helicus]
YYELAHRTGSPAGQRMVALLYATGLGVPRDYARALLYMSFAAVGGDTVAEQTLGYWHLMGIGTPKNCEDAAWYLKRNSRFAAAKAHGMLGTMYWRGEGVAQNNDRARSWFQNGVKHKDPTSLNGLGMMMING